MAFIGCSPVGDVQGVEQHCGSVAPDVNIYRRRDERPGWNPAGKCCQTQGAISGKLLQHPEENQDFKIREIKKVLLQDRVSVLTWAKRQNWSSNGERISCLQDWTHAREVLSHETYAVQRVVKSRVTCTPGYITRVRIICKRHGIRTSKGKAGVGPASWTGLCARKGSSLWARRVAQ